MSENLDLEDCRIEAEEMAKNASFNLYIIDSLASQLSDTVYGATIRNNSKKPEWVEDVFKTAALSVVDGLSDMFSSEFLARDYSNGTVQRAVDYFYKFAEQAGWHNPEEDALAGENRFEVLANWLKVDEEHRLSKEEIKDLNQVQNYNSAVSRTAETLKEYELILKTEKERDPLRAHWEYPIFDKAIEDFEATEFFVEFSAGPAYMSDERKQTLDNMLQKAKEKAQDAMFMAIENGLENGVYSTKYAIRNFKKFSTRFKEELDETDNTINLISRDFLDDYLWNKGQGEVEPYISWDPKLKFEPPITASLSPPDNLSEKEKKEWRKTRNSSLYHAVAVPAMAAYSLCGAVISWVNCLETLLK